MNFPVKIFIIYAHEDAQYKDELIKAFSPLKNQGWVESWHDGNIDPGQVWDEHIRQNLNAADIVLPLVSSDFFSSEYIQQVEIRHAFERFQQGDCALIPVIVRACTWEADERLARLQVLPKDGKPVGSWTNRDEAYQSIAAGIQQIVRPINIRNNASFLSTPDIKPLVAPSSKTSWKQKVQPLIKPTLEIGAAIVTIATFFFVYSGCPKQASPDAQEQKAFQQAMAAGTIPALDSFRMEFPDGFRAVAARQQLAKLQISFDSCIASARALHRGGEPEEAQKAAVSASRIHPDDPQLKFLFQELGK